MTPIGSLASQFFGAYLQSLTRLGVKEGVDARVKPFDEASFRAVRVLPVLQPVTVVVRVYDRQRVLSCWPSSTSRMRVNKCIFGFPGSHQDLRLQISAETQLRVLRFESRRE